MTASTIVNGAPLTIMQGIHDLSTRTLIPDPENLPTHLAHIFGYAQTGPTTPQLVVGVSRTNMYGVDSFDVRKKWATHQTVLSNAINAAASPQMFQRVVPADAGPAANFRVYADVLPTQVDEYQRNADGSIKVDADGVKQTTGTKIAGFKVKYVVEFIAPDEDGVSMVGKGVQKPGDQTDATTSTQSVRYPLFDVTTPFQGSYGNNAGLRLWAPTAKDSNPVLQRVLTNNQAYPFRFAVVRRESANATPRIVPNQKAEQYMDLVFKPNTLDTTADKLLFAGTQFVKAYQDINNPNGNPPVWGDFGAFYVYQSNLDTLLAQWYTAEKPYIDAFSDFQDVEGEEYLFNFLGGVSSQNVPYHSFQLVTDAANSQRFSQNSTIYARGGSDGTMSNAAFAQLVKEQMADWADENSYVQDRMFYPQSIMYDSGFPLETKYAMCQFISVRKDTAVVLATHDAAGVALTASEESSLAIALRTRLQMYPESEFFGTQTVRGCIIGRSGVPIEDLRWEGRLPLSIDLAQKAATYMGAGNGKWVSGAAFDESPTNQVKLFTDINVTFTPDSVKNKDWANGLVWVEHSSRRTVYYPAFRTVYDDDTSVLTAFPTMMACVELQKIGDRVRHKYSGNSKLTKTQLTERIIRDVNTACVGKFDDRFIIVPEVTFTEADNARGYSWTLKIKIYANNMMTVETLIIESYRMEDFTAAAA